MATFSAERSFKFACNKYEEAKEVIRELSQIVQNIKKDFSFEIAMREYDELLQCILLKVALSDGHFLESEKQFIAKITDYGDILLHINRSLRQSTEFNGNITWDTISSLNENQKEEISNNFIMTIINDDLSDFVDVFAVIDALTPTNYLEIIKDVTMNIIGSLCLVDGDDAESNTANLEFTIGEKMFELVFGERWEKVKNAEQNN